MLSVNDYLARRDAEWMAPVYALLGVSVAWVGQSSTREERRRAYAADVTYGAVSEIGFDLLRDRLCTDVAELVLPEPGVALIDEADSVLVDEARVPLVLAGSAGEVEADRAVSEVVRRLRAEVHYEIDDNRRSVYLTGAGAEAVEAALGGIDLYSDEHAGRLAAVNVALHAHALLRRDVDYIVRDGRVQLISESRGRVARLQRWPDGLQAAVEVKESLPVSRGGEVLDSITVQALVGRYPRVCGMTGTAVAVAEQLREFYGLEAAVIPPNRPCIRVDEPDRVFASVADKEAALVAEVAEVHATGRPVLVGTLDVAESERLARKLTAAGVENVVVLNARNDAEEAAVVAEAGALGAVTVSTQMAGRGTDIRLGGANGADHDEVAALGGLYVVGSGRYPSSRLDNQLRGRAGRQGDPGGSVFFSSMRDELVTGYAPDAEVPGEVADNGEVTGANVAAVVDFAQRVAEGVNLETHRDTWRYSKLVEHQREVLLEYRGRVLREDVAVRLLEQRCAERWADLTEGVGEQEAARVARLVLLHHLDRGWTEHLEFLTDLREGIHLRALAREDPLDEFHRAAIPAFKRIVDQARDQTVETVEKLEWDESGVDLAAVGIRRPSATWTYLVHDNPVGSEQDRVMKWLRSKVASAERSWLRR